VVDGIPVGIVLGDTDPPSLLDLPFASLLRKWDFFELGLLCLDFFLMLLLSWVKSAFLDFPLCFFCSALFGDEDEWSSCLLFLDFDPLLDSEEGFAFFPLFEFFRLPLDPLILLLLGDLPWPSPGEAASLLLVSPFDFLDSPFVAAVA
jgi:hypothetical protein